MNLRVAPPPFCLDWRGFGWSASDASRMHLAVGQILWRESNREERVALIRDALGWPRRAWRATEHSTRRHGERVRERTGKSLRRQAMEQFWLALTSGVPPSAYYRFRLYVPEHQAHAHQYLHRYETKDNRAFFMLGRPGPNHKLMLGSKERFDLICREAGLPVPKLVMRLVGGEVVDAADSPDSLPPRDLFIKPVVGRGGTGAARWDWVGDGFRAPGQDGEGEPASAAALLEQLREQSRSHALLVQERVPTHPEIADLSNGALTTARVMTCQDERGQPEVVAAVFRMAVGGNQVIDNIHAGGIASPVDLASGTLGRASALSAASDRVDEHPTTGAKITGRRLPEWAAVLELAAYAHEVFNGLVVVGWDIAMTPDGPLIVEGNSEPCVNLIQRPHDAPLGAGRFGELLAYHLDLYRRELSLRTQAGEGSAASRLCVVDPQREETPMPRVQSSTRRRRTRIRSTADSTSVPA